MSVTSASARVSPPQTDSEVDCGALQGPLHIDDPLFRNAIAPLLASGPSTAWKLDKVMLAVPVLRNRICFWVRDASPESTAQFSVFHPMWEDYLERNPTIMKLVDPDYVHFAFPAGLAGPAGFALAVVSDPREGAVAVPLPGGGSSSTLFRVASMAWGYHLVGRLHAMFPAVEMAYLRSNMLVMYYR